ncbi:MAG: hypothetical protein IT422_06135 [Pirellulaceae bacterium]|nr:hypothetical protein [Pirellulaceae bacterium]
MHFTNFLNAIYNRLAGLVVEGLFRRFEAHRAIDLAALQAEVESKIKLHRDAGATKAAALLEADLERIADRRGTVGVTFANELLADSYADSDGESDDEITLSTNFLNGESTGPKKRGRKKLSS